MKIDEAIQVLERTISEGGTKEEVKLKQSLSNILHELKSKALDAPEKELLEKELDLLVDDLEKNEKQLKARYKDFIKMLNRNFAFIPEGKCAGDGLIYGVITGTFLMSMSIAFTDSTLKFYLPLACMLLGMLVGSLCDRTVKKQGRALLTKMF
ncbi:MAG: hypothetical protein WBL27_10730 [Salinimicrobium sp.]